MNYVDRVKAAQATKDHFFGKLLDWGSVDCLQIAAHCLEQLGHTKPTKTVRKYTSETGAIRALKASGYSSLIDAVNDYGLTPIPPAAAMAGDIIAYPGEGFGGYALGIALGDNKILGIAPNPLPVVDVAAIWAASHAWRAV